MSAFTAYDDRALLHLVVLFEGPDRQIDWSMLKENMPPPSKTTRDLEERLEHLMYRDTTLLSQLPVTYVAGSNLHRPYLASKQPEIYKAIEIIFRHFTRADVRQPSGQQHLNAGEIAPVGVTVMIEALELTTDDIFLDIGSGTGSVVAQIAIQSPVSGAIGLEVRSDLAQKSRHAICSAQSEYPRLRTARILTGDVKWSTDTLQADLGCATVVFSNNAVFEPQDNWHLHRLVCLFSSMSKLRLVMLSRPFCFRCSDSCRNEFCTVWEQKTVIMVKTCWKDSPQSIYVYQRRLVIHRSFLHAADEL